MINGNVRSYETIMNPMHKKVVRFGKCLSIEAEKLPVGPCCSSLIGTTMPRLLKYKRIVLIFPLNGRVLNEPIALSKL
jgi:hypothetical protein